MLDQMTVLVCMLRSVNVGGHNKIKMDALRGLLKSLGLINPVTHIQSGNVIFGTDEKDLISLAVRITGALERTSQVRSEAILRTPGDLSDVIARNPFSGRSDVLPNRLHVSFLLNQPGAEAAINIRKLQGGPEELHLLGKELFMHFPNGMGSSKVTPAAIERALKVPGTARNWNTIEKLLELARKWQPDPSARA
jgi:uncharacterized protein (DUF1697 family)